MRSSTCSALAALLLLSACDSAATDDALYARERALPKACTSANPMTLAAAADLIHRSLPTVPITVVQFREDRHRTHRDSITGVITMSFNVGDDGVLVGMEVAHELAHAAVLEAFRNTAGPFEPSNEKAVPAHGAEFVNAYKVFLAQIVSRKCAEAL